ncbi:hypothetical protein EJ03DRAFT_330228, partial [Teratosphaeria nubilosa]
MKCTLIATTLLPLIFLSPTFASPPPASHCPPRGGLGPPQCADHGRSRTDLCQPNDPKPIYRTVRLM